MFQDEEMPLPVGEGDDDQALDSQDLINGTRQDDDMEMRDGTSGKRTGAGSGQQQNNEPRKPNKVRITTPYLTKYERARILGTRALQIR